MDLILWRHAEAEPGGPETPDLSRSLTAKGHKQAWKMAEWLDVRLPSSCRILVSPAMRTVQTADALGRKLRIEPDLGPDTTVEKILKAVNWPHGRDPVLLVGHQPVLGQLAATLIGGTRQNWSIRKANIWWITQRDRQEDEQEIDLSHCSLRVVMTPELLRK
ncbi:MAG: histidine phosphatase family protein [Pseudomonadota bacterium]